MDDPFPALGVFFSLSEIGKQRFIEELDSLNYLQSVRAKANEEAQQDKRKLLAEISALKESIKPLKAEIAALKQPRTAAVLKGRKERLLELHAEGWEPSDIADRMTADDMPISEKAVRRALERHLKRPAQPNPDI